MTSIECKLDKALWIVKLLLLLPKLLSSFFGHNQAASVLSTFPNSIKYYFVGWRMFQLIFNHL